MSRPVYLLHPDPSPRSRKAFFVGDFLAAPAKTYILASRNSDGQFSSSSVPWYTLGLAVPAWTMLAPCPHFSCHIPRPPTTMTHFCLLSAPWCGSPAELGEKRKKKTELFGILMRPSSFHYVVISYFTALTGKAQETPEGLSALHTGWRGRREEGSG